MKITVTLSTEEKGKTVARSVTTEVPDDAISKSTSDGEPEVSLPLLVKSLREGLESK